MCLLVEIILAFDFDTADNAVFICENCTAEALISEFNAVILQPLVHRNADTAAGVVFCKDGSRSAVAAETDDLIGKFDAAFHHHVVTSRRLFHNGLDQGRMVQTLADSQHVLFHEFRAVFNALALLESASCQGNLSSINARVASENIHFFQH